MANGQTERIQLEIVTPQGPALTLAVDEVTAPSVEGEFGVMPGHLPLLAALRTGLVTYRIGGETKKCAVGGGFAEAGPTKLVILTDQFIERDGVDPVLVRKELAEIEAELSQVQPRSPDDKEENERERALIERENWLAAQLELYGDPPPPTMRPFELWGPPPLAVDLDDPEPEEPTP
jgi:F-type H+-transporting ATPase subunit epsilon